MFHSCLIWILETMESLERETNAQIHALTNQFSQQVQIFNFFMWSFSELHINLTLALVFFKCESLLKKKRNWKVMTNLIEAFISSWQPWYKPLYISSWQRWYKHLYISSWQRWYKPLYISSWQPWYKHLF